MWIVFSSDTSAQAALSMAIHHEFGYVSGKDICGLNLISLQAHALNDQSHANEISDIWNLEHINFRWYHKTIWSSFNFIISNSVIFHLSLSVINPVTHTMHPMMFYKYPVQLYGMAATLGLKTHTGHFVLDT